MSLDISEYVGKYIPLKNGRLEIGEMAAYLASEGLKVEAIQEKAPYSKVTVSDCFSNKYQVTVRGFVKKVGRDKARREKWLNEQKKHQSRKSLVIDNSLIESFEQVVGKIPFQTWVKRKMREEIYGSWQSKSVRPKKYELVNDMVLVDDGNSISLCHISEFNTRQFELWTRIPPRSIAGMKLQGEKRGRKRKGGVE